MCVCACVRVSVVYVCVYACIYPCLPVRITTWLMTTLKPWSRMESQTHQTPNTCFTDPLAKATSW